MACAPADTTPKIENCTGGTTSDPFHDLYFVAREIAGVRVKSRRLTRKLFIILRKVVKVGFRHVVTPKRTETSRCMRSDHADLGKF